jgi:hypothetical protein
MLTTFAISLVILPPWGLYFHSSLYPNSNGYLGDGELCWMTSALAYLPTVVFVLSCLLYKL